MRVVGYYNSFCRKDVLEDLDIKALTQINYAFLMPKSDGTLYFLDEDNVRKVVNFAHKNGIKAFVSIGGWCDENEHLLNPVFEEIMNQEETKSKFINNALSIVNHYDFDGIDLDWEYPSIDYQSKLEDVVSTLSSSIHKQSKEFSMAIHSAVEGEEKFNRNQAISNTLISMLDFFGVMTYDDKTQQNHSSTNLSKKCVKYWTENRNVERSKVLIGIPFYTRPSAILYSDLISMNKYNALTDFSLKESYNGIYTVREKTHFARFNCGGLIIWAINYDSSHKYYSLLKTIRIMANRKQPVVER